MDEWKNIGDSSSKGRQLCCLGRSVFGPTLWKMRLKSTIISLEQRIQSADASSCTSIMLRITLYEQFVSKK